jgi:site-specific recombinase XerD
MKSDILELRNLISGFKICCQTEGKSPKTIEWYDAFLRRFRYFLDSNQLSTVINQINRSLIRQFIIYLQSEAKVPRSNKSLSPATIQGYVRTLKVFFSWARREEYIVDNPMTGIPIPKAPRKMVNTFTIEQVTALIRLCHISNHIGHRNLIIILLLLDTGIRVSELVGICVSDVILDGGFIKVKRSKGNKEREVPIGTLVQKALWKYMNLYRPEPLTDKITSLFLNENSLPLTRSGVQQMLRRLGRAVGLTGVRCSPHTFRHSFAKNYLLNGGDIFSLQKILGHSSLASVRVYLNLLNGDVKAQHQKFSPADNLSGNRMLYPILRSVIR